jgi:hypothetical protein
VDTRNIPLPKGEIRWVFPNLADTTESEAVRQALLDADATLHRVGRVLGADADHEVLGIPMNRIYFQRLGPEPDYPVTVLMAEGGSDQVEVFVLCTPGDAERPSRRPGQHRRPGPPWLVDAGISVSCDSGTCAGHPVSHWSGVLRDDPVATASDVRAAAAWLLDQVTQESEMSLRARDPLRGHDPQQRSD